VILILLISFFPYPSVTLSEIRDDFDLFEAATGYPDLTRLKNSALLLKDSLRSFSILFSDFSPEDETTFCQKEDGAPMRHFAITGGYFWRNFKVRCKLLKTEAKRWTKVKGEHIRPREIWFQRCPYRMVGDLVFVVSMRNFDFGYAFGYGVTKKYWNFYTCWYEDNDFGAKMVSGVNYNGQLSGYDLATGVALGKCSGMFNPGWEWWERERGYITGHLIIKDDKARIMVLPEVATEWLGRTQTSLSLRMEREIGKVRIHFEAGFWHHLLLWHEKKLVDLEDSHRQVLGIGLKGRFFPFLITIIPRYYYEVHRYSYGLVDKFQGVALHGGLSLRIGKYLELRMGGVENLFADFALSPYSVARRVYGGGIGISWRPLNLSFLYQTTEMGYGYGWPTYDRFRFRTLAGEMKVSI